MAAQRRFGMGLPFIPSKDSMARKRIWVQVIAGIVLYTGISLLLEQEVSQEVLFREFVEGLIFGGLYGLFLYIRQRWFFKNDDHEV